MVTGAVLGARGESHRFSACAGLLGGIEGAYMPPKGRLPFLAYRNHYWRCAGIILFS
jgi:hypothetical protein